MKIFKINNFLFIFLLSTLCSLLYTHSFAEERTSMDTELDKVWGLDKSIDVVKEERFLNQGMHEFTIASGVIPNNPYYLYLPVIFRYSYFFTEELGLELNGRYLLSFNSDLKTFLDDREFYSSKGDPEKLVWTGGGNLSFVPFKGKISLMGSKLFHFNICFYLGGGGIGIKYIDNGAEKSKVTGYGELGLGTRMYLSKHFALRLDYRNMMYPAVEGSIAFPADITFGISGIIK